MQVCLYTLNHYYKGVKRLTWNFSGVGGDAHSKYVWQLVPDLFHLDAPKEEEIKENMKIID